MTHARAYSVYPNTLRNTNYVNLSEDMEANKTKRWQSVERKIIDLKSCIPRDISLNVPFSALGTTHGGFEKTEHFANGYTVTVQI